MLAMPMLRSATIDPELSSLTVKSPFTVQFGLKGMGIAPAGVTNVVRLMKRSNPKVEKVKPELLIDDRILKKIDQSGFIDEVYAKYGVK